MQLKTRWLWCALASMMCGTVTKAVAQDDDGGGIIVDAAPAVDFWVATWGNDFLSYYQSTPQTPFKTILRAQYAVRQYRANNPTVIPAIVVHIAGGEYSITQPLVFDAQDSGWANWPIRYIAWDPDGSGPLDSDVLVSGGYSLTNWVGPVGPPNPDGSLIYQTHVPDLFPGLEAPRDLWVNGIRCPRSRFPDPEPCTRSWNSPLQGPCYGEDGQFLRGFVITNSVEKQDSGVYGAQFVQFRTADGSSVPTGSPLLPNGIDWSQVEVVGHEAYLNPRQTGAVTWDYPTSDKVLLEFQTRRAFMSIAGSPPIYRQDFGAWGVFGHAGFYQSWLEIKGETTHLNYHPTQAYFENSLAFLNRRYEWSYDRNSRQLHIALCAQPGTDFTQVIVPVSQQLLVIDRASYLSFEGIDWAYSYKPFPKLADGQTPGYTTLQSGVEWLNGGGWHDWRNTLEGAIWLRGAQSCTFESCRIGHVAGRYMPPSCAGACESCSGEYAGWYCAEGHPAMPLGANYRVSWPPDAVATQTSQNAGPNNPAWFPGTGDRVYGGGRPCLESLPPDWD